MPDAQAPSVVSLMDTTLRDGEQTPQLAFTAAEKLHIARALLIDLGVNRIEVASTCVSDGELDAARRIVTWARDAGCLERVELLAFCDGERSPRWMGELGGGAMNLLLKGSEDHCRRQLGLTPEAHLEALERTVLSARELGVRVAGAYLEDWSRGACDAPGYVRAAITRLRDLHVPRVYLADTLGCLSPAGVAELVGRMVAEFPDVHFEFHGHNDYGLATANALAAVSAGARGVHTSVNGLGERAGNARLGEVAVALRDHTDVHHGVQEAALARLSTLVETFSGKLVADNTPIVGRDVFTQTAGVHADGDRKGGLYETRLSPERFGRRRDYALGKLAGRASLDQNLERLGIALSPGERDRLLARVVELGDQKRVVHPGDLPFLINDLLGQPDSDLRVADYTVTVRSGERAFAEVTLEVGERRAIAGSDGAGGYDAVMAALRSAAGELGVRVPRLADFRVRIPPGGGASSLVETAIQWGEGVEAFTTVGVDPDQIGAAVIATEKMLRLVAAPAAAD
ncbi:MAG: hypothetical protein OXT09_00780 [Myxococcales bacterium]|nr:hypothetical protein [Myxococcales bacterium]